MSNHASEQLSNSSEIELANIVYQLEDFANYFARTTIGKNEDDEDGLALMVDQVLLLFEEAGIHTLAVLFPPDERELAATMIKALKKAYDSLHQGLQWKDHYFDLLITAIEKQRQNIVIGSRIGVTINARNLEPSQQNVTRSPLNLNYDHIKQIETYGIKSPSTTFVSEENAVTQSSNATLKLTLGFDSSLASLSSSFSASKSLSTSNYHKRTIILATTRKVALLLPEEYDPQDIMSTEAFNALYKFIVKFVAYKRDQKNEEEQKREVNELKVILYDFFTYFGTHYCTENWIGSSKLLIEHNTEQKEIKSREITTNVKIPTPVGSPSTSVTNTTDKERGNSSKNNYSFERGKINNQNEVESESVIYAIFEPVYNLFRKALYYTFLRSTWEEYITPSSILIYREKHKMKWGVWEPITYILVVESKDIRLRQEDKVTPQNRTYFQKVLLPNGTFRLRIEQNQNDPSGNKKRAIKKGRYLGVHKPIAEWVLTTYRQEHPNTVMFYDPARSCLGFAITRELGPPKILYLRQNHLRHLEVSGRHKRPSAFHFRNESLGKEVKGRSENLVNVPSTKKKDSNNSKESVASPSGSSIQHKSGKQPKDTIGTEVVLIEKEDAN